MKRIGSVVMIGIVKAYQMGISSWIPARCRYLPTCSEYAIEAIKTHGACRGAALALQRLLRCHPWGGSGLDPVPPLASSSPPKACCTHHESESR